VNKTVLLLSYYFSPCNYVAANRPNSFAKELAKSGFEVIVVTRHWTGKEQVWNDYLVSDHTPAVIETHERITVHRLPYIETSFTKNKLLSKYKVLQNLVSGKINHDVNYYQFKPYIEKLISSLQIDYLMVSIPPLNALRLSSELSKKYNLKLFVDVRDYENFNVLNKNLKLGILFNVKHWFNLHHSIKWFNQASLIFTITPPMTEFIKARTKQKVITVMNGFQERLLSVNEKECQNFSITLIGSLYDIPELDELLSGFKMLFSNAYAKGITVRFIGSNTSNKIESKIREAIPPSNLVMAKRMPQEEAQLEAARSQLLLVLGFKNMKGVLGTKGFEYMGLRKTILQMPADNDLMQQIILECNAGYCPNTPEEFTRTIKNCFTEWQQTGNLKYNGNIELIKKYAREEQFKTLLPYFK
jgi:hypothetical protein